MERSSAYKAAFGGILLAIAVILQIGGAFIPGIDLTLFALASILTAIVIVELGPGAGIIFYFAASVLAVIFVPNKVAIIPYVFFFGYWGIIKFYIEKIKKGSFQILCKCAFFAVISCVALLCFSELLMGSRNLPEIPVAAMIPIGIVFMLLYDYLFSAAIELYFRRFKRF